mgnify:CR=1 FL=1|jgi:predicted RNA-binding Zn-ribbon protein involved in translation (DUF1610 family)
MKTRKGTSDLVRATQPHRDRTKYRRSTPDLEDTADYQCPDCGEGFAEWEADTVSGPHERGTGWQYYVKCPYCGSEDIEDLCYVK